MTWLCRAQDQNGRGGVSALYYLGQNRWDIDYPETTGYIIPTFLCYAHLTGKSEFLDRARGWVNGNWPFSHHMAVQENPTAFTDTCRVYSILAR